MTCEFGFLNNVPFPMYFYSFNWVFFKYSLLFWSFRKAKREWKFHFNHSICKRLLLIGIPFERERERAFFKNMLQTKLGGKIFFLRKIQRAINKQLSFDPKQTSENMHVYFDSIGKHRVASSSNRLFTCWHTRIKDKSKCFLLYRLMKVHSSSSNLWQCWTGISLENAERLLSKSIVMQCIFGIDRHCHRIMDGYDDWILTCAIFHRFIFHAEKKNRE